MGVHWNAGLMRWLPFVDPNGRAYPLNHLHPFRFVHAIPPHGTATPEEVLIHVGFGLHCFTSRQQTHEHSHHSYSDARETREFDAVRYRLSKHLPGIVRTLARRRCSFGKNDNFVTVDMVDDGGAAICLAVFFNLKKWSREGRSAILLVVQSAYPLTTPKKLAEDGRVGFNVLVRHALKGTRPKRHR